MSTPAVEIIGIDKTKIIEALKVAGIELFYCDNCLRLMPKELKRWNEQDKETNCPDCIE